MVLPEILQQAKNATNELCNVSWLYITYCVGEYKLCLHYITCWSTPNKVINSNYIFVIRSSFDNDDVLQDHKREHFFVHRHSVLLNPTVPTQNPQKLITIHTGVSKLCIGSGRIVKLL